MSKFLVAIGTSHLAGDCDENMTEKVYADYVAERMNVPLHKFSLSGAENIELLQIFNEINHEYLTDDCVGVIVDVRITSNSFSFPKGLWLDYDNYADTDHGQYFTFEDSVGLKTWHTKTKHEYFKQFPNARKNSNTKHIINTHVFDKISAPQANVEHIMQKAQRPDGNICHSATSPAKIVKAAEILQYMIVAEHDSIKFKNLFENYQLVCAMKNIVVNKGINFAYLDFGGEKFTPLDKYVDFDKTLYDYFVDLFPEKTYHDKTCGCGHLNPEAHGLFGQEVYHKLKEIWKI